MKLKISEEIIKKTKDCDKNFICLKGKEFISCKITGPINQEYHIVGNRNPQCCNYTLFFKNSSLCNCPTRKAIFDLYKF